MGTILLEGMEFFAYHGCYKEEQIIGTKFIVDLSVGFDSAAAERSDRLQDTVNYTALFQCVKREMGEKSHLLEHLAKRILDSIRKEFPMAEEISLKISKINPPMGGRMQQVSYRTCWQK
jgi:7,8-dihydroneopterin aldolase/epimerase/oxygenase